VLRVQERQRKQQQPQNKKEEQEIDQITERSISNVLSYPARTDRFVAWFFNSFPLTPQCSRKTVQAIQLYFSLPILDQPTSLAYSKQKVTIYTLPTRPYPILSYPIRTERQRKASRHQLTVPSQNPSVEYCMGCPRLASALAARRPYGGCKRVQNQTFSFLRSRMEPRVRHNIILALTFCYGEFITPRTYSEQMKEGRRNESNLQVMPCILQLPRAHHPGSPRFLRVRDGPKIV